MQDVSFARECALELLDIRSRLSNQVTTVVDSLVFKSWNDRLQDVLIDLVGFAALVNDAGVGLCARLDPHQLHFTVLLLGYKIIDANSLGGSQLTTWSENTIHLGLVAFLLSFVRRLDNKIADNLLLYKLLNSAVREDIGSDPAKLELLLWILFIGWTSVFKDSDKPWVAAKTKDTLMALGLYDWEAVRKRLTRYPWVHVLHDKLGSQLWQRSMPDFPYLFDIPVR
jgi:hypothetical protein